jgi:hypothetical protein
MPGKRGVRTSEPRSRKVDYDAVIAAMAELSNGRAVARKLGMHHQTVYQILRRAAGACLRCGSPKVVAGKTSCAECLKFDQDRIKKDRKHRRRMHMCQQCDQPVSQWSRQFCEAHRLANLDRAEERYAKKKASRGFSHGEASSEAKRHESIFQNYGQGGLDRWKADRGACQICKREYGAVSVQLHHIDQNKKNNAFENFGCLCFDCHQSVHRLLGAPSMTKLLAWFGKTYPHKMSRYRRRSS